MVEPSSVTAYRAIGADRYQSMMYVLRWLAHARGVVPSLATKRTAMENQLDRVVPAPRGSVWMAGVTPASAQEFCTEVTT